MTTPFFVYSHDPTSANSVAAIAESLGTIPYEVGTSLASRVPRLYRQGDRVFSVDGKVTALTILGPRWCQGKGSENGAKNGGENGGDH